MSLYCLCSYFPSSIDPYYTLHVETDRIKSTSFPNSNGYFTSIHAAEAACRWINSPDCIYQTMGKTTYFIQVTGGYINEPSPPPYDGPLIHFEHKALAEAKEHGKTIKANKEQQAYNDSLSWWDRLFQRGKKL